MAYHVVKKGLTLPIAGQPDQFITKGNVSNHVGLLGDDYHGLKPTFVVEVGERVKLGQPLFVDKQMPSVKFTSPGAGVVAQINRGERRRFISIVVRLDGVDAIAFKSYSSRQIDSLSRETIIEQLLESGVWTSLRTRPFSRIPDPQTTPHSIFVSAMDTNPLAPSVEKIIERKRQSFVWGLTILSKLTDGKLYLCKTPDAEIPTPEVESLSVEEFAGPHPAGNPGLHIHLLDPVSAKKTVWVVNAQDVIVIGSLFASGRLDMERVVSLGGAPVKDPRLIRIRVGAALDEIIQGELKECEHRVVSGSVFSGRTALGAQAYLGRYHRQISVLKEEREKYFLGWLMPGLDFFSVKRLFLSAFLPSRLFHFNTSLYGAKRAIVPIGSYEKVMPFDIEPTFLFRALAVNDTEEAEKLGCLELDEEDVALCSFVCPSKNDFGAMLRANLDLIAKEG
jgi:Na+-transporting NADH:ubiquinone oxidoreductase subunit A